MGEQMKARGVVFTGPGRAEIEEFELSDTLAPHGVRVRNRCSLISAGTELAAFTDNQDIPLRPKGHYPRRAGYAAVGEVMEVGSEVTALQPGDLVFTPTAHASAVTFDAADGFYVKVPDGIPAEQAVFCRLAVVGMSTLTTCTARPGDWVAVCGQGLVGNLAAQVFRLSQMRVIALEPSPFRRERAQACGTEHLFAPTDLALPDSVKALTAPEGCCLGVDCTGRSQGVLALAGVLASGAELVLVGAPWQRTSDVVASELLQAIFFGYLHVRSGWEWQLPAAPTPFRHGSLRQNYRLALDWIQRGELKVGPVMTHRLPAAQVQQAYEGLLTRPDSYLGVVLEW